MTSLATGSRWQALRRVDESDACADNDLHELVEVVMRSSGECVLNLSVWRLEDGQDYSQQPWRRVDGGQRTTQRVSEDGQVESLRSQCGRLLRGTNNHIKCTCALDVGISPHLTAMSLHNPSSFM